MAYQTINPSVEAEIIDFPEHTDAQLGTIIAGAEKAYRNVWRRTTLIEGQAVLAKAASLLRSNRDRFAKLVTLEMGKMFTEALRPF